jgi:hypothetical protein
MHSEDDSKPHQPRTRAKKCPICEDTVYLHETRPVRWYHGQEGKPPSEGTDVVLRLMKRPAGSTLALPRDGADMLAPDEDVPWYFAAEVMDYARVMKGTKEYMTAQFEIDIEALEIQEREDEVMFGDDNVEWVRRAVRTLREAQEKLVGIGNAPSEARNPIEVTPRPPIAFSDPANLPDMYQIQHSTKAGNVQPSESQSGPSVNATSSQGPADYYFYQALLHYYLSPLDIRILKEAFGSFASFPATILPRVEHVSTGHIVDEDLRKRAKYLGHLPRGCEVSFLECDWTDTVSSEVLEKFSSEIERRRKRNQEKEAEEERARIRAEREEEEIRYAHLRRRRPDEPSSSPFHKNDFLPLGSQDVAHVQGLEAGSPPWAHRRSSTTGFGALADISTSPSTSRTVWGTPAVAAPSPQLEPAPKDDHVDDGWLQGWEKDLLADEADLVAEAEALSIGDASKPTGGKKKKNKKITLMTTNARRGA